MASFYEVLGFKKSPYYRGALEPTKEDFARFVGRTADIRKFMMGLSSTGVHLITGRRGVGKTSFLNAMQYICSTEQSKILESYDIKFYPEKMLPCYMKIQLEKDDSADKVLLKVISSIVFSADRFFKITSGSDLKSIHVFEEFKKKFNGYIDKSFSAAEKILDTTTKYQLLTELIKSIKVAGRKGVFLTVDNLDIIDIKSSTRILNELRDYLFIDDVCVVLLGPEGMYTDLRSTEDGLRVIDRIVGQELLLEPLSEADVIEILRAREKTLAMNPQKEPKSPLDKEYVKKLYKITKGQVRLLFKICESLVMEVLSHYPSMTSVNQENAEKFLKDITARETNFSNYSKKQNEILKACLDSPKRSRDYKDLKLDSGAHFVRNVDKLVQDDLLSKRADGQAVYYDPTGLLNLSRHVELI